MQVGIVVLLLSGVADALAATVVRSCVKNGNGQVRIITSGSCKAGETEVDWNIQGPQGPEGPSQQAFTTSIENVNLGPSFATVASLSVPAGSYVAQATVANLSGTETAPILCSFGDITYVVGLEPFVNGSFAAAGTLAMHTAVTMTAPGSIQLQCVNNTGQSTATATIRAAQLTAIKVGSLTGQ